MPQSNAQRSAKYRQRHPARAAESNREGQQRFRDSRKPKSPTIHYNALPADQAGALCEWSRAKLVIPPGHLHEGQAFDIPDYGQRFIQDALADKCRDSLFCCGRKNSKTGISAVIVLGHLGTGPLARPGFRAGCASTSRLKAGELKSAIESTALASGLGDVEFWRRSQPAITAPNGSVDVLSADKNSGAAAGYDLVLIDEIGLLQEKDRSLVTSLRSSLTAKRGRMVSLSIYGSGPFVGEYLDRQDDEAVAVHMYQPPADSKIDDEVAWHLANPGLSSGVKSLESMRVLSRAALACPADQAEFRSQEMNLPGSPTKELICTVDDWRRCVVEPADLPPREGRAWLALDPGGSASMTSCACAWENGRLEFFSAFPSVPSLEDRGVSDGCGGLYVQARDRGELRTYSGRVTPVADFLAAVLHDLAGVEIVSGASDRFRKSEVMQILEDPKTGAKFPWEFVPMGCGERGSGDVRALQRSVLRAEFKTLPSLLFASGLSSATIRRDGNSNPGLERGGKARIDLVSALVLAAGLRSASSGVPRLTISRTPF